MGMGYAIMEEVNLNKGEVKNKNFSDYIIPTAPAVLNAIYDAVGVRIYDMPATSDK